MLQRHQNELLLRLERVADVGCAEIRKWELLLWYGYDRLTRNVWRDLLEKWEEIDGEGHPLLVGDSDGLWVFIYGDGLTTSATSWFKDVRDRAKAKAGEEVTAEPA
jgi:hypothetical protein